MKCHCGTWITASKYGSAFGVNFWCLWHQCHKPLSCVFQCAWIKCLLCCIYPGSQARSIRLGEIWTLAALLMLGLTAKLHMACLFIWMPDRFLQIEQRLFTHHLQTPASILERSYLGGRARVVRRVSRVHGGLHTMPYLLHRLGGCQG